MHLKDHDLKQLNRAYLASLSPEQLLNLAEKLLNDLRDARDRQNQTPQNSSRPSGSYAPWEQAQGSTTQEQTEKRDEQEGTEKELAVVENNEVEQEAKAEEQKKRKSGRQPGAKGFGRTEELPITGEEIHKAENCVGCGKVLGEDAPFEKRTGSYTLDIKKGELGLEVTNTLHLYGITGCVCGHWTESKPGRCEPEEAWNVEITEWHLVGPTLASLIICLSLRMRLSRPRIREFLADWLGISLSKGCISKCIAEGGRAAAPLEDEFIADIQQSELLHVDETGWKENGKAVWLWVLKTATVTFYTIGSRSWDTIADIMEHFAGWLMSDGYGQYRQYGKRLRCLAHIIRKARGLGESCHPEAAEFGKKVLEIIKLFISGIYEARGDPTIELMERYSEKLKELKALCEKYRDHEHEKTKKLARELLNDWAAIWTVLHYPQMPITNNLAEQALRHWVISRKISYGTRTRQGSRAYTILASVIDTCRQRDVSPWDYIAQVIGERRKNNPVPPLPAPVV
jgi:hypothetical protein